MRIYKSYSGFAFHRKCFVICVVERNDQLTHWFSHLESTAPPPVSFKKLTPSHTLAENSESVAHTFIWIIRIQIRYCWVRERKRAILSTISHSSHHCHCCFCYNYSDNNQNKSTIQKISLLEHLNASYLWTLTTRRNFPHERTRTLATVTQFDYSSYLVLFIRMIQH